MTRNINIPIPQNPIGESFQWRDWFQKLSNVVFGSMAAQDANNISVTGGASSGVAITGGSLAIGSNPAVTGSGISTAMTGTGAAVNSNGSFAIGNPTSNIVCDGTNVYLHGFVAQNSTNLNTVFLDFVGGAAQTIMTFTLSETSNVILGTNCSARIFFTNNSSFTPPAWGLITTNIGLVNASGTQYIFPGSTYGYPMTWAWAPGVLNSTGSYNYIWYAPISYSISLNLPAGTYRLQLEGSAGFHNAAGNAYTPSQSSEYIVDAQSWWYTVNA